MNNIMQPDYGMMAHSAHAQSYEGKQNKMQDSSFFKLMAQFSKNAANAHNTSNYAENIEETSTSKIETYQKYLKTRFGTSIKVQDVGKDQRSMDKLGAGSVGFGNVVIAPNILEEMANNPDKAAYYEAKIQHHFDFVPQLKAELSMMGHELHSCGVVIHSD